MAKDKKDKSPPTNEQGKTPFQKFERLAKALVTVPKGKIDENKRKDV